MSDKWFDRFTTFIVLWLLLPVAFLMGAGAWLLLIAVGARIAQLLLGLGR